MPLTNPSAVSLCWRAAFGSSLGRVLGAVTLGQRAWLERRLYLLVCVECQDAVLLGHVECLGALL